MTTATLCSDTLLISAATVTIILSSGSAVFAASVGERNIEDASLIADVMVPWSCSKRGRSGNGNAPLEAEDVNAAAKSVIAAYISSAVLEPGILKGSGNQATVSVTRTALVSTTNTLNDR